jgi:hypothetical protein
MPSPLLRAPIIAALLLVLVLLAGCSALRLGYGQADSLAFRWFDGYAEFDDAQSLRVRQAIAAWFDWHRRTQLGDYAELLDRIDAEVLADTTPQRVCAWWGAVRERIDRGVDHAVPAFAEVVQTLKPAQFEQIERRQAKSNAEFHDQFLQPDPVRRLREAARRFADRAEWLYGDVDRVQRERIAHSMAEGALDPVLLWEERRRRQEDGLRTMRGLAGLPPPTAEAELRGWLQRLEHSPREAYRREAERQVARNCRLFAELHNATSTAQRRTASNRLRGWAADLRAMARDAGA